MVNSIPHSSSPLISGTGLYSEISCHYVEHQSIDFATLFLIYQSKSSVFFLRIIVFVSCFSPLKSLLFLSLLLNSLECGCLTHWGCISTALKFKKHSNIRDEPISYYDSIKNKNFFEKNPN